MKVTDLLFADHTDLLDESEEGLREITRRLESVAGRYGMEVSSEKSKVMVVGKQEEIKDVQIKITMKGKELEQVTSFTYLGANINNNSKSEKETRIRTVKASSDLAKFESTWKLTADSMPNKLRLMRPHRSSDFAVSMRELGAHNGR